MILAAQVVLGHVDCTSNKAAMRTHFNLKGFPCLLFWRKQSEPLDELVGKTVVPSSDSRFMIARLAGIAKLLEKVMTQNHDHDHKSHIIPHENSTGPV